MSLQGTGSASQYWAGVGPFSSYADRPFSIAVWVNTENADIEGVIQISNSGYGAGIQTVSGAAQLIDGNDTYSYHYAFDPALQASSWQFVVATFAESGGTDYIYLNGINDQKYGITSPIPGVTTYGTVAVGVGSSRWSSITTLISEASIWSGTLSPADIANLYNGGAGGKGVNPCRLVSSSGAILKRYYLPTGSADFADHSGNGGATLAPEGGAAAKWNSSDPPVDAIATAPPLIACVW